MKHSHTARLFRFFVPVLFAAVNFFMGCTDFFSDETIRQRTEPEAGLCTVSISVNSIGGSSAVKTANPTADLSDATSIKLFSKISGGSEQEHSFSYQPARSLRLPV